MTEKITFTNINIRQSIAILLAKLVLIDIVSAVLIVVLYSLLVQGNLIAQVETDNIFVFSGIVGLVGIVKISVGIYIVLQWLNEYYEITPMTIVHKKGIIFKKIEAYDIDKIRVINVRDSFLGEVFNYATITLYEIRLEKLLDMYLIHNPHRYAKILKSMRPHLEIVQGRIGLPFFRKEEI